MILPNKKTDKLTSIIALFIAVVGIGISAQAVSLYAENNDSPKLNIYFDLGRGLIEEFKGTYMFKYKKREFIKNGPSYYTIKSSGDQSPSEQQLYIGKDFTSWTHLRSKKVWLMMKNSPRKGDKWENQSRDRKETYEVMNTGFSLITPAGKFSDCLKLKISYIAHEHDMEGLQEIFIYLAPHLGIVKQEFYEQGSKWHEEILTNFTRKD